MTDRAHPGEGQQTSAARHRRAAARFDLHRDLHAACRRALDPPYHSKYNAIERYWAGLERSSNGYLLSTVEAVLNRAGNFCWKGMRTIARLVDGVYEKGVKVWLRLGNAANSSGCNPRAGNR